MPPCSQLNQLVLLICFFLWIVVILLFCSTKEISANELVLLFQTKAVVLPIIISLSRGSFQTPVSFSLFNPRSPPLSQQLIFSSQTLRAETNTSKQLSERSSYSWKDREGEKEREGFLACLSARLVINQ